MTQNGITFNSVKTGTVKMGYWPITLQGQTGPDDDGGIVNAVDIDWNGAVLPNGDIENGTSVTINTTGDLLKLIDKMNEQIYALSAAVIAIGTKVS
jgi:hypothetical protein